MRVKVIVPEGEDFDRVAAEVDEYSSIYVKSKRRRFIAADEPPVEARREFKRRGIEIVVDRQFDLD